MDLFCRERPSEPAGTSHVQSADMPQRWQLHCAISHFCVVPALPELWDGDDGTWAEHGRVYSGARAKDEENLKWGREQPRGFCCPPLPHECLGGGWRAMPGQTIGRKVGRSATGVWNTVRGWRCRAVQMKHARAMGTVVRSAQRAPQGHCKKGLSCEGGNVVGPTRGTPPPLLVFV